MSIEQFDGDYERSQPNQSRQFSLTYQLFSLLKSWKFWSMFFVLCLVGTFFLFGLIGQLGFIAILMFYAVHIFEISAAGDDDQLTYFPSLDLFDSLIRMAWFLYVLFFAIFPGAIFRHLILYLLGIHLTDSVSSIAELSTIDMTPILISSLCMLGCFFLFLPILILSGMSNDSPFNLYSPEILRSLWHQKKTWGFFYLLSFILLIFLYAFLFFAFWGLFVLSKTLESNSIFLLGFNAIVGAAATGTVFIYFRLVGRLAFIIGKN